MNLLVDKIYICHYKKLIERKKFILDQLNQLNLNNYEFVEDFEKENLNSKEINNEYKMINHPSTKMTDGEKSLALKHALIIKKSYDMQYNSVLILEDDAVLTENFIKKFNDYYQQLPINWDIAWVGSCFHLKEPEIEGINVYKTNRGSRCTHAFCISQNFLNKIHKEVENINLPSDHYYNFLVKTFNLNNYWFQPPLAFQSLNFYSSLNSNPKHKWDPKEMG
jgi:GR25 family glycosyltransferase involved in LPS biosynthesis